MSEKIFSKDELIPPIWMDGAFFTVALKAYLSDPNVQVNDFTITPGTKPGEHYGSVMFKVTINFLTQNHDTTLKVVVKAIPEVEGHKKEFLEASSTFQNEAKLYSKILPEMQKLEDFLAPKLIYQNMNWPVIILEDISPGGYKTLDDVTSDWNQIQLAIKKLAQFHALSICLDEQNVS